MLPEIVTAVAIATGCQTKACEERVKAKTQIENKRKAIRPFRGWLYRTRMCESGGRYWLNTGNGFYGAYQFTLSTWHAAGGWSFPHLNGKLEQDYRAVVWRKRIGNPHQAAGWPVCG